MSVIKTKKKLKEYEIKIVRGNEQVKKIEIDGLEIRATKSCELNTNFISNSTVVEIVIVVSRLKKLEIIKE